MNPQPKSFALLRPVGNEAIFHISFESITDDEKKNQLGLYQAMSSMATSFHAPGSHLNHIETDKTITIFGNFESHNWWLELELSWQLKGDERIYNKRGLAPVRYIREMVNFGFSLWRINHGTLFQLDGNDQFIKDAIEWWHEWFKRMEINWTNYNGGGFMRTLGNRYSSVELPIGFENNLQKDVYQWINDDKVVHFTAINTNWIPEKNWGMLYSHDSKIEYSFLKELHNWISIIDESTGLNSQALLDDNFPINNILNDNGQEGWSRSLMLPAIYLQEALEQAVDPLKYIGNFGSYIPDMKTFTTLPTLPTLPTVSMPEMPHMGLDIINPFKWKYDLASIDGNNTEHMNITTNNATHTNPDTSISTTNNNNSHYSLSISSPVVSPLMSPTTATANVTVTAGRNQSLNSIENPGINENEENPLGDNSEAISPTQSYSHSNNNLLSHSKNSSVSYPVAKRLHSISKGASEARQKSIVESLKHVDFKGKYLLGFLNAKRIYLGSEPFYLVMHERNGILFVTIHKEKPDAPQFDELTQKLNFLYERYFTDLILNQLTQFEIKVQWYYILSVDDKYYASVPKIPDFKSANYQDIIKMHVTIEKIVNESAPSTMTVTDIQQRIGKSWIWIRKKKNTFALVWQENSENDAWDNDAIEWMESTWARIELDL
ncbi:hypothetical protein DAMA08_033310 [Martiniozyma asiatica (nom. inval.)]|nr:hypothetical protein DAMA08_033310 [Martiniozyma asiatica]